MKIFYRAARIFLLFLCVFVYGLQTTAVPTVNAASICEPDGIQASGAVYRICMPAPGTWNSDLVVYAHGYVAFNEPIAIPEDQLSGDDFSIPDMINELGYAFAATSYSVNGLAVKEGIDDVVDLVDVFSQIHGEPDHVYLVGPSAGGIITALTLEQHFDVFDGGVSACGPVGDFQKQINYWGDVRLVFDYFFPGVIPGDPFTIPQDVIDNWDTAYETAAEAALRANPSATRQLIRVTHVPTDPQNPDSGIEALLQLLWYNVFATNDGIAKLGGQPYGNRGRFYLGSTNDWRLNRRIPRFNADPAAVAEMTAHYQTSGDLTVPLVTLHTLRDPVIPYWHEPLYLQKIVAHGDFSLQTHIPSLNYGHCNFNQAEVLAAFAILVYQVTGELPVDVSAVLEGQLLVDYHQLIQTYDLPQ